MKIILHIGADKCGSTAIQNCLFHNEQFFKEQGFFIASHLPKRKSFNHSIYFLDNNVTLFNDLIAKLHEVKEQYHTAIISWEGLIRIKEKKLNNNYAALKEFDLEVIAYVRDQAELIQTGTLQRCKSSMEGIQINTLFSKNRNFYLIAEKWSNFIGKKIQLSIFNRKNFPEGNVVFDFLLKLGITKFDDIKIPTIHTNDSLTVESAHVLSMINKLSTYTENEKLNIIDAILIIQKHFNHSKYFLPKKDVLRIREYHKESNALLESKYQIGPVNSQSECWREKGKPIHLDQSLLSNTIFLASTPILIHEVENEHLIKYLPLGWKIVKDLPWTHSNVSTIKFRVCIARTRHFVKTIHIDIKGNYSNNIRQSTDLIIFNKRYKDINLSHFTLTLPVDQIPENGILEIKLIHPYRNKKCFNLNYLKLESEF